MAYRKKYEDKPVPMDGLGILICQACGKPYREHRVAHPCPALGVDLIKGAFTTRSLRESARRKREYRVRKEKREGEASDV